MVRPSLEALAKIADDKKIGGVFAGQRRGSHFSTFGWWQPYSSSSYPN